MKDVIHDMHPIRNNVIQCIDFAINLSEMIFFYILLSVLDKSTIDYNKG